MMTTDATRLRQSRSLAEVDLDSLIRSAHLERNRLMVARSGAALRSLSRSIGRCFQIVPRILPVE